MGFSAGLDGQGTTLGRQIAMRTHSMTTTRPVLWTAALVLAPLLGAPAFAASAVAPNCRAIESANARLSCYDAAFPQSTQYPAEKGADMSRGYKDPFLVEEARTAARLKGICRGC